MPGTFRLAGAANLASLAPMHRRQALVTLVFTVLACVTVARAADNAPYIGTWSNGRGEELVITAKTIKFAKDKPVPYEDITGVTDGKQFKIKLNGVKLNFLSPYMVLIMNGKKSMKSLGFDSRQGFDKGSPSSEVNWDRDR
jgi:hypothetical protein